MDARRPFHAPQGRMINTQPLSKLDGITTELDPLDAVTHPVGQTVEFGSSTTARPLNEERKTIWAKRRLQASHAPTEHNAIRVRARPFTDFQAETPRCGVEVVRTDADRDGTVATANEHRQYTRQRMI